MSGFGIFQCICAVILFLLIVVFFFLWNWADLRTYRMLLSFPSVSLFPVIGDTIRLGLIPPEEIMYLLKGFIDEKYRYARAILLGYPCVILFHPDDVEAILGGTINIKKGFEYFTLRAWLGEGLLISDGNKWRQRRKLLTPTFHFNILEDYVGQFATHSKVFVEKLLETNGEPVELEDSLRQYTLDVICDTAMGVKLNAQKNGSPHYVEAIRRASQAILKRTLQLWLRDDMVFNLTAAGKRFKEDMDIIHSFSEKVIKSRREEKKKEQNEGKEKKRKVFLDILIEEEHNSGLLTPDDIRQEVDTFMFEGHDTTSSAIIHALYSLANHSDIQERVHEEQIGIFGSDKREPTKQDLQDMVYLEMVIKEVLRLYPSVPYISRTASKDTVLGDGKIIPAGANVIIMPFLIHRDCTFWDDPEEFRPERFLPGINRHPYSYIPFSAGPRNCIGMKFAMMHLKTTLSRIIRYCRIEPVTKELKLAPVVILKNHVPIKIRVLPRERASLNKSPVETFK